MKSLICVICLIITGAATMADELCDDPKKYWDFEKLSVAPKFEDATFPDSKAEGMRDILFDGVGPKGTEAKVFAYISYPKTEPGPKGYPGIVLVHGGGGTAMPYFAKMWNDYGYAVITMDWYNTRPINVENLGGDRAPAEKAPLEGGRRQDHVANVANLVLSHSLLRSLDNIDKDRIGYVGLSWGSWYGAIVTAVDPRFKVMIEIYLGDYTGNPNSFINGRFLHASKVPMYWVAGTNDGNGSPETLQAGFDHCATPWNKSYVIRLPHSHDGIEFQSPRRVADHFLMGKTELPLLGKFKIADGCMSAPILSKGNGIVKAILCYTCEADKPYEERNWESKPAEVVKHLFGKDEVKAELPEGVYQCFLSLYDGEDVDFTYCHHTMKDCTSCGSSDIYFADKK